MNTQEENKVSDIKATFEQMQDGYSYSEALLDCINAINLSQTALEEHLSRWLWLAEGEDYKTEEDKAYAITLGRIEEVLVLKGLIYNS